MNISGVAHPGGEALRIQDVDQAMCALFGPLLNQALLEEIDKMEWPENAITSVERSAAAAALDSKIVALEREIADLLESAEDAGIAWNRS